MYNLLNNLTIILIMGMYTEFIFGCELSKDTPRICIEALDKSINDEWIYNKYVKQPKYDNPQTYEEQMFNKNYIERTLSDEEIDKFIDAYDFSRLFHSCSYYFGALNPICKFSKDDITGSYHISTRADLKNYSGQIEKFIEYIQPYVIHGSGYENQIFAYVQYEEDAFPTIYGTTGKFNVMDPDVLKHYSDINNERIKVLKKLYNALAPEYTIDEKVYAQYGKDPDTYKPTYNEIWEWTADYIISKYQDKKLENSY